MSGMVVHSVSIGLILTVQLGRDDDECDRARDRDDSRHNDVRSDEIDTGGHDHQAKEQDTQPARQQVLNSHVPASRKHLKTLSHLAALVNQNRVKIGPGEPMDTAFR
jgi:hypothetical protein